MSPKPNDIPPFFFIIFINFLIPCHIALYLFFPEFLVCSRQFTMFFASVPKARIYKYNCLIFFKTKSGVPKYLLEFFLHLNPLPQRIFPEAISNLVFLFRTLLIISLLFSLETLSIIISKTLFASSNLYINFRLFRKFLQNRV
jgi:hypothetical protein